MHWRHVELVNALLRQMVQLHTGHRLLRALVLRATDHVHLVARFRISNLRHVQVLDLSQLPPALAWHKLEKLHGLQLEGSGILVLVEGLLLNWLSNLICLI